MDTSRKFCHEVQVRDIQSQNIMMFGFLRNGVPIDACRFFTKMLERNCVPWNSMISYFNDSGNTEFDVKLFAIFLIENVVVWTKMVAGLTPEEPASDLDDECSSFVASSLGPFEVNESTKKKEREQVKV